MTRYEELLQQAYDLGVEVIEDACPRGIRGLYLRDSLESIIVLNRYLSASERLCVLAEELAHHHTAQYDIRLTDDTNIRKQEILALSEAIEQLVPFSALAEAFSNNAWTRYALAEYLDIPEDFVHLVVSYYDAKYPQQMAQMRRAQPIPGSGLG